MDEGSAFAADVLRIEAVGDTGISVQLLLAYPILFLSRTYHRLASEGSDRAESTPVHVSTPTALLMQEDSQRDSMR